MATRTIEKIKRFRRQPSEGPGWNPSERGVLEVSPGALEFRGMKNTLVMTPVHDVVAESGCVRVVYGEPSATAYLTDFRAGSLKTRKQNQVLERELRELLGFDALAPEEAAILEAKREGERVAQGHSKMRSGRRTMWIGGVVAIAGALITGITYAAAEPGGRYFLLWGAIIFGAAQFFIGLAQFKEGQKASGGRPLPTASKGAAPTAASVGLADVAALKERRDVDGLVAALGVNELEVRVQAMDALAELANPHATDLLIAKLQDTRWDVRWSAAEALGKLDDARAIDPLTRAVADENAMVRAVAEASLRSLKGAAGPELPAAPG